MQINCLTPSTKACPPYHQVGLDYNRQGSAGASSEHTQVYCKGYSKFTACFCGRFALAGYTLTVIILHDGQLSVTSGVADSGLQAPWMAVCLPQCVAAAAVILPLFQLPPPQTLCTFCSGSWH